MSGELIYRPMVNDHFCKPPMEIRNENTYSEMPPIGTVWRCECGVLWEVVRQPYINVFPKRKWVKAGWRARWKYR